jgi:hypothetical protein
VAEHLTLVRPTLNCLPNRGTHVAGTLLSAASLAVTEQVPRTRFGALRRRSSHPPSTASTNRPRRALRQNRKIASYALNQDAVAHAKSLIDARQYVLRSRWQNVQPRASEQNAFLKTHSLADYALWHLGLTEGAPDQTKARYAFVFGDFRRLHRMGLIACQYRAAEWRHKEIELAAHELLQYLDGKSARQ